MSRFASFSIIYRSPIIYHLECAFILLSLEMADPEGQGQRKKAAELLACRRPQPT